MSVPVTNGTGSSSVASELIGTQQYQQIKIVGGETGSTSVLGVNPDRSINVSVLGTVATTASGQGSVIAVLQSSSIIGVVTGSVVTIPTGNQSVSGTVGSSVIGWVPIQASNTSIIGVLQTSSIIGVVTGSVVTVPGNSSTITIWQNPSIVGTYIDDAAHGNGARGLGVLAVRNDTLASVTSTDGDYSHISVGPSGEIPSPDAPYTRWVSGVADLRVVLGASVTAIPAQGASVFTYVREVQVANFGSASVLVKIAGGLGSTLGWTIAPAGGGSNFLTRYKTGENSAVTASINGTASVLVTVSGFTARI